MEMNGGYYLKLFSSGFAIFFCFVLNKCFFLYNNAAWA